MSTIVSANGIEICCESWLDDSALCSGAVIGPVHDHANVPENFEDDRSPLLMVSGLGAQLTDWHSDLLDGLVARDFRVTVFDNRDSGLSTHFHEAPVDVHAAMQGDYSSAPYTLDDLANDTVSLLDTLGISRAHIIGHSMGGMIAQLLAIRVPERVSSLVLISSTTGDPSVGQVHSDIQSPAAPRDGMDVDDLVAAAVETSGQWTSWSLGVTLSDLTRRMRTRVERAYDPGGTLRQRLAMAAAPDRTAALRAIDIPTVVIHGTDDPRVDASGGKAIAAAIPDAELIVVENLRHDIPKAVCPIVIDAAVRARDRSLARL